MTITAKLADGRTLNFPDGTDPQIIQRTVRTVIGGQTRQPEAAPTTTAPGTFGLTITPEQEAFLAQQPEATPGVTERPFSVAAFRPEQAPEAAFVGLRGRPATEVEALARETAEGPGGLLRTGAIFTGSGLFKLGRALGLAEPAGPGEKEALGALRRERPVVAFTGEAVGETLPFAAVPVGAIAAAPARVAATTLLGGIEAGLVRRGEGESITEQLEGAGIGGAIAGVVEAALPLVGRASGKIIRKAFGRPPKSSVITAAGQPTGELTKALEKTGLTFDDVKEGVADAIAAQGTGAPVEQRLRQALFEELEIPATRGDITQEYGQQATEARLFESAADPLADPLRSRVLEKGRAVKSKLDTLVEQAGVPEDVGTSIKDALTSRKGVLRKRKNALYKQAAESAKNPGALPFPTDALESAIPNARTMREIKRIEPQKFEAFQDLLAEFGIDRSEEALQRLETEGIEVLPLSVDNFDEFRRSLNRLMDVPPGAPNPMAVIAQPVKDALDNEADNLAGIFEKAGVGEATVRTLQEARKTVRQLKTEFSPQSIAGKMIGVKRDGFTPLIESSKVFNEVVGTNKPVELLKRTVTSLKKSGPEGVKALGDLQAATIVDLIESAFKAEGRKVQGEKVFGNLPFNKRFNQIGDERLELIFSTNKPLLAELRKVNQAVKDMMPPSGAAPKGSASVILDTLNKVGIMTILGKVPGGGLLAEGVTRLSEGAATRRAVSTALEPRKINPAGIADQVLPSLSAAMGMKLEKGDENE
jgi:hypothetical protein